MQAAAPDKQEVKVAERKRQCHIANLYNVRDEGVQKGIVTNIKKTIGLELKISRPRHEQFVCLYIEGPTIEEASLAKDLLRNNQTRLKLPDGATLSVVL